VWLGGKAAFNVRSLMEVALERCDSARCAIDLMGSLAEKHGFYCVEGEATTHADCSEALTIGDPKEAWVFHITADDTHESAVWVAQRVPDGEIAAIANQFVIRGIDVKDKKNFMASKNIFEVAERCVQVQVMTSYYFTYLFVHRVCVCCLCFVVICIFAEPSYGTPRPPLIT
jgi:dipeptidase